MIFYQAKSEGEVNEFYSWLPYWGGTITEEAVKKNRFRINGKVYDEYSTELLEAHEADIAWDRLMYKDPRND